MKDIVVIGSINIDTTLEIKDFPKEGETISSLKMLKDVGGKGLNQAVALRKAGADPLFLSAYNPLDPTSAMLDKVVTMNDLDVFWMRSDKPNGTAYIILNDKGENEIIIHAGSNEDVTSENLMSLENAKYIVLQNEIPEETNEYILREYKDKIIVYNPSPLRDIKEELLSSISYLVVNEHEITHFSNKKTYIAMAQDLLSRGVKNVLLTLGDKGSILYSKDEIITVNAVKTKVIDTVAAGDTYLGYFVSMLSKGRSKKEAMEIASLASSICVSRKGAISAIPSLDELTN